MSCWVRLADRVVALSVLRAHPEHFTRLFERSRAELGYGQCLCVPEAPPRLVLRCRSGRYHLAAWPERGHDHRPTCPWYRPEPALSGRAEYTGSGIVTTDAGTSLRLAAPLVTRSTDSGPRRHAVPDADRYDSRTRRRSLSLLAVVHCLWEQARLSVWSPHDGRRTWATCHDRLVAETRDCTINGGPLENSLYVVPQFEPHAAIDNTDAWDRFVGQLGQQGTVRRRGLVLGEVRRISPTEHGVCVRLAHQLEPIFATRGLMERARRAYRSALTETSQQRHRIALLLVDRSPTGWTVAVDMAFMLTSAAFLPCDSAPEVRMANALVAAGRTLTKPLRYDRNDSVFPDFVLLDTTPMTFIEVWGVTGREEYERRKQSKRHHYRSTGRVLLDWDVRDPFPDVSLQP